MTFANAVSVEPWEQRSNYSELRSGWEGEEVKTTILFQDVWLFPRNKEKAIAGRRQKFLFR